jgi:hypothetical protein
MGAQKLKIKEKEKGKIKQKLLLSLIFHRWLILEILIVVPLLIIGLHCSYECSGGAR